VKRQREAANAPALPLPHERDENAALGGETPGQVRPRIRQAQVDVERGLVDTERRGTPSDVPAPEGADAIRRDGGGNR
jgi:hypothetical protein